MARSQRLGAEDYRAVYELVGECRELGADWRDWRRHLLVEVNRLIGGPIAYALETKPGVILAVVQEGVPDHVAHATAEYNGDLDRGLKDPVIQRIHRHPDTLLTRSLSEFVAAEGLDPRGTIYQFNAELGLGDVLFGRFRLNNSELGQYLAWHRSGGEAPFRRRDVELVGLINHALQPHLGKSLALAGEPVPSDLSPRPRQVLDLLLEGESEKRIASLLGLRSATVHGYIHQIYLHFGVSSRAELLAGFLRRARGQTPRS